MVPAPVAGAMGIPGKPNQQGEDDYGVIGLPNQSGLFTNTGTTLPAWVESTFDTLRVLPDQAGQWVKENLGKPTACAVSMLFCGAQVIMSVTNDGDFGANSGLFRGGDSVAARLGVDVKPAADGLIHPLSNSGKPQGLSLNLDPKDPFIQKYGGAFPVNSLPEGLQALQSGKPGHFVVAPVTPMTFEKYQQLLNKIQLGNFNVLP
jgi:hypothetical protein